MSLEAESLVQLVTKSKYSDALATLLESVVHGKLTISEYHRWAHEIWSLVEMIVAQWSAFCPAIVFHILIS
jgi:hypothetical protein